MVGTPPTTMPVRIFCMRVRGWRGLPGVVGVRAPPGRWGSVPAGVVVTSAGPFRLYVRGSAVVGAPGVGGDEAADECGRPQPVGGGEHGEAAEPVPGEGGAELAAHRVFLRSGGRPRGGSFRGGGRSGVGGYCRYRPRRAFSLARSWASQVWPARSAWRAPDVLDRKNRPADPVTLVPAAG